MNKYTYYKNIFKQLPMPFAFVDLDLLVRNIESVLTFSGDKQIRIATKSIRSIKILKLIMQTSDRFQGVLCYSVAEAAFLAEQGFDDILIGYPIGNSASMMKAVQQIKTGKKIIFMVDSEVHLKLLSEIAQTETIKIHVCLDIDLSTQFFGLHFGVFRSPIHHELQAVTLAQKIENMPELVLAGVMGYEAQIAGVPDKNPGQRLKSTVIRYLKKQSLNKITERRGNIVNEVKKMNKNILFVNGGGTGSLQFTSQDPVVTEVTAGSAFFSPGLFDHYKAFQYEPACGFALEIARQPSKHKFTCLGGGYVASGVAEQDKLPKPYLPEGISYIKNEGAGEVQTPIIYDGQENLTIGDPVFFRHSKSGELCERFQFLYCVENGQIVKRVTTYRGDGQCFL